MRAGGGKEEERGDGGRLRAEGERFGGKKNEEQLKAL